MEINYHTRLKKFCEKIGISKKVLGYVLGLQPLSLAEENKFFFDPQKYIAESRGNDFNRYMLGFYIRLGLQRAVENFVKKGLGEETAYATLGDIALWSDVFYAETGDIGLADSEIYWLIPHMSADIMTLGRLQFRPNLLSGDLLCPDGRIFKKGIEMCEVHIPRGEALLAEKVDKSFEEASKILGSPHLYYCNSWLLSPVLKDLLPPESNILKFAKRFYINKTDNNNDSAFRYLNYSNFVLGRSRLSEAAETLKSKGQNIGAAEGWLIF